MTLPELLWAVAGAIAVVRSGAAIQVIVGPEADNIASDIEDLR